MYTQLNQYHVVMEVAPRVLAAPRDAARHLRPLDDRHAGAAERRSRTSRRSTTALAVNHQGQFPAVTLSFNLAPGVALGDAVDAIDAAQREIGMPATIHAQLPGHGAGLPGVARQRAAPDPGGAGHRLHRARHALRELHPPASRSSRRCRRRASARSSRCCSAATDLSVIALIGIILLIGIVKKNAIMMIDFALEAERDGGQDRPEDAIYEACLLRFRPIMMTTMAALLGGAAAGARHGARARSCAGRSASRSSAA